MSAAAPGNELVRCDCPAWVPWLQTKGESRIVRLYGRAWLLAPGKWGKSTCRYRREGAARGDFRQSLEGRPSFIFLALTSTVQLRIPRSPPSNRLSKPCRASSVCDAARMVKQPLRLATASAIG